MTNRNSNQIWTFAVDTDAVDDGNFGLFNGNTSLNPLKISPSGAATFSSSVTTTGLNVNGNAIIQNTLSFRAGLDNVESFDIRPLGSTANFLLTNYRGAGTSSIQFNSSGTTLINQDGGNVGIGTDAPTGKLEIRGLQSVSKDLLLNLSKFDYGQTSFYQNYSNTFYSGGKSLEIEIEGLPLLQLAVNNAGSLGKVIFPNGNVLLGTTTDAGYKLDVNGTARVSGTLRTTGNAWIYDTTQDRQILIGEGSRDVNIAGATSAATNTLIGFSNVGGNNRLSLYEDKLLIASTGTATFSGQVNIGNPVAAAVAVASTHKVEIVIGGTTYYLLATT